MRENNNNYIATSYFAGNNEVPDLLTEQEAIRFLRLDDVNIKHPETSLEYYRLKGLLRATRVGKKLRYLKSELLNFLEEQTKITNGDIS